MAYSQKVIEHYENPRNVGSFDKGDASVGTGMVFDDFLTVGHGISPIDGSVAGAARAAGWLSGPPTGWC